MRTVSIAALLGGVTAISVASQKLGEAMAAFYKAPETVSELDPVKYSGRWFQMYGSASTQNTFEKGGMCAQAIYHPSNNTGAPSSAAGALSVFNTMTVDSPQPGPEGYSDINGWAYIPDASQPGQLLVHLDGGAPFDAPYWVLALGPEGELGYEWSVISDNMKSTLFILARDVATFRAEYEADVLALVKSLGFTSFYNKPVAVYQGPDCAYEEDMSIYA